MYIEYVYKWESAEGKPGASCFWMMVFSSVQIDSPVTDPVAFSQ